MEDADVITGRYIDSWGGRPCFVIRNGDSVSVKYDDGSYTSFFVKTFIKHGFELAES